MYLFTDLRTNYIFCSVDWESIHAVIELDRDYREGKRRRYSGESSSGGVFLDPQVLRPPTLLRPATSSSPMSTSPTVLPQPQEIIAKYYSTTTAATGPSSPSGRLPINLSTLTPLPRRDANANNSKQQPQPTLNGLVATPTKTGFTWPGVEAIEEAYRKHVVGTCQVSLNLPRVSTGPFNSSSI